MADFYPGFQRIQIGGANPGAQGAAGFAKLGDTVAGGTQAAAQEAGAKAGYVGAETMNAIAQARQRQQEAQSRQQIGNMLDDDNSPVSQTLAAAGVTKGERATNAEMVRGGMPMGDIVGSILKNHQGLATMANGALGNVGPQLAAAAPAEAIKSVTPSAGVPQPNPLGLNVAGGPQNIAPTQAHLGAETSELNAKAGLERNEQGQGLTDDAAYAAAVRYNNTGVMPPMGMGNGPARAKILQMGAMLQTDPNWHPTSFDAQPGTPHPTAESAASTAGNQADFTANKSSLTTLSRTTAQIDASAQTVQKQFGLVRAAIAKAGQTGSPAANWVENATRQNLLGSGDVSSYKNALTTARTEYARVISMATGATGITDEGRRQGESLFPDNLSPEQFEKNAAIAQKEMDARTNSQHEQMESLRTKLHGTPPAVGGAAPKPGANAPTLSPEDQAMLKRLSGGG